MQKNRVSIDLGSVSAKIVILDKNSQVLFFKNERVLGRPVAAVKKLLAEASSKISSDYELVLTGSLAGAVVGSDIIFQSEPVIVNELRALAQGVSRLYPDVSTIFEMGGQTSKFIHIEKKNGHVAIVDYGMSGDCAAGTGSFIDQQAERLHYKIEDVGALVSKTERAAKVAGRCSVFAKSDMIHAQQKGYKPAEILKGLCNAVARNYKATIVKGRHLVPKVAFVGGVALNKGVELAIRDIFNLKGESLIVPDEAEFLTAYGAAIIPTEEVLRNQKKTFKKNVLASDVADKKLTTANVRFLRDLVKPYKIPLSGRVDAYLGIDVGSVSTNFVLIDENGEMIHEIYTYTKSRPIEVVSNGLKDIELLLGNKVNILGVGATGSGRELIGELVGADVIKDEITAHKTGALHICEKLTGEKVDTIFEIGGQDAKYIKIENGIVTDFAMNEACAAGTGSFLEEQASRLGISIKNEFAKLALESGCPVALGERCTVFMERDVNAFQMQGSFVSDIAAGLAFSVATNYLNRVVRGRKIGDHIFFQGGTAYNDAVAAAFSQILGKQITVPPHNGVVGAIGAALLAQKHVCMSAGQQVATSLNLCISKFRGFDLEKVSYSVREFACNACTNACDIQEFTVDGAKTYWGDKCSSRFRKKAHTDNVAVTGDLIRARMELLMSSRAFKGRKVVGIPRSMFFFDRFPFWKTYIEELGFSVVVSDETNKQITNDALETTIAEPCFPIKLTHGHVKNLIGKKVDYIFLPNVISAEKSSRHIPYLCPWHQTQPFVVRNVGGFAKEKFLVPTVQFEFGKEFVAKCLGNMVRELGVSNNDNVRALEKAYSAQAEFKRRIKQLGVLALKELDEKFAEAIVLVGRPYNIYDGGANLNVATKLRQFYGLNVIPFDMLPLDDVDIEDVSSNMFWDYGRKIVAAARFVAEKPNLHLIYITNFKCGPDSFIKHFSTAAAKKPYLTLQFDEHANDAGVITRIEAYLESKGLIYERTKRENAVYSGDGLRRGEGAGCGVHGLRN